VAAVVLPHDWLTWRMAGGTTLDTLVTDRSDASGTGYFDAVGGEYRRDLLALALRDDEHASRLVLPEVLGPREPAGRSSHAARPILGPGCGDNAGAALGLGLRTGQTMLSIGTSCVVASTAAESTHDASGAVAGFADATGRFLTLAATLNGARVLDATCRLLGVSHDELSTLALAARSGADGLVHVPYLEGERTPNLPCATGSLTGMTLASLTRENLARAAVEGILCLLADALEAVRRQNVRIEEVWLVGGGARSEAVRRLAPGVLGVPVFVPEGTECVADGAARQAAWVLGDADQLPVWRAAGVRVYEAEAEAGVLDRYRAAALRYQDPGLRVP
jgi:xylulokinase